MSKKNILLLAILTIAFFLRFYKIESIPPGLYTDEASIGYNAYSILKTGKDEFDQNFPLWFKSFGDYKPPVYIYLTSASLAVFGKNEFAVRFPSALLGTLTVLLTYFLVLRLFKSSYLALLTSLLLAVSPWHLQFSRAAFEANVALFFFVLATFLALKFWQGKKALALFLSFFFYGLTLYTYHAYRVITLFWIVFLLIVLFKKLPKLRKTIFMAAVFLVLLSLPFIQYSFSEQGQARFNLTSAFVYEKPQNYPAIFLKNYLSYFSLPFLFSNGDGIGRHQIDGFGPVSYWQLPFLIFGLFLLLKKRKEYPYSLVLLLLFLIPLPAALARPSPHTLRSLPMVIPICLIVSLGITGAWKKVNKPGRIILVLIFLAGVYEFLLYSHSYYVHYPQNHQTDWGAGYKQMVEKITALQPGYTDIFVSDSIGGQTNIYFLFYGKEISPNFVPLTWQKPKEVKSKILFVTEEISGSKKKPVSARFLENIYLANPNKDIFVQFWEL